MLELLKSITYIDIGGYYSVKWPPHGCYQQRKRVRCECVQTCSSVHWHAFISRTQGNIYYIMQAVSWKTKVPLEQMLHDWMGCVGRTCGSNNPLLLKTAYLIRLGPRAKKRKGHTYWTSTFPSASLFPLTRCAALKYMSRTCYGLDALVRLGYMAK